HRVEEIHEPALIAAPYYLLRDRMPPASNPGGDALPCLDIRHAALGSNYVRIDELIDPPGTREKLGCGSRLPGAVRTGDYEEIRHAAIFSFEIRLLTPALATSEKNMFNEGVTAHC